MTAINITSIILAIVCFLSIFLTGILTSILREKKTKLQVTKNSLTEPKIAPLSYSRFQLWLWTLVIIPAFILNWGFNNPLLPYLNLTSLILLGIPSSVTLTAGIITSTQINLAGGNKLKVKKDKDKVNIWADLLMDDNGQFSLVRLQQLIFTIVYIVIFITSFIQNKMVYPDFDNNAFVLMGISAGTYLIGKGNHQ